MKIVFGLGNPGERYRSTRHNVGFRVLDEVARRAGVTFEARGDLGDQAWTARITRAGRTVLLAKPRTFMNRSGSAAAALCRKAMARPGEMLVVFDDADLVLGRVRVRSEGGAGGHNGLRSIIESLGSVAFPRVKIGVRGAGREAEDLADYVLRPFDDGEREVVEAMVALGADAVESVLSDGVAGAMARFNAAPPEGPATSGDSVAGKPDR